MKELLAVAFATLTLTCAGALAQPDTTVGEAQAPVACRQDATLALRGEPSRHHTRPPYHSERAPLHRHTGAALDSSINHLTGTEAKLRL